MKILVIRLHHLAEVLCATPLIRCMQKQLYPATVHVLTAAGNEPVLKYNPFLHHLHLWYYGIDLHDALQAEAFTHVIDLQNDQASKALIKSIGLKATKPPRLWWQRLMPQNTNDHLVEVYFKTASLFGVQNDGKGLDFYIPKEEETKTSDIPAAHHLGFIVVHLHLSITQAEAAHIKEACQSIAHPFIITGSSRVAGAAQYITTADETKIYSACGKFSFNETADLLKKSKLVITADEGTAQVAAALQKPVILLQKPSPGLAPYYGNRWGEKKMWAVHVLRKQPLSLLVRLVQEFLQSGKLP